MKRPLLGWTRTMARPLKAHDTVLSLKNKKQQKEKHAGP